MTEQKETAPKGGMMIASPKCGRSKKGVFRCVCGKCEPLEPNVGKEAYNLCLNSAPKT